MEQPFDLTDLDWSPALLVAVHDSDEQNARLAGHIWEDNGLDIPESYLPDLLTFLGKVLLFLHSIISDYSLDHENAYVRTSAAAAFIEAVDHWPSSTTSTLIALQDLYRDKVCRCLLSPLGFHRYHRFHPSFRRRFLLLNLINT